MLEKPAADPEAPVRVSVNVGPPTLKKEPCVADGFPEAAVCARKIPEEATGDTIVRDHCVVVESPMNMLILDDGMIPTRSP